jgi:hypothetical protein
MVRCLDRVVPTDRDRSSRDRSRERDTAGDPALTRERYRSNRHSATAMRLQHMFVENGMAITQRWCHVLGTTVTRVTDLEGWVERVICPHYDEAGRICTLRADALNVGPLAQLLERVAEDTLASRGSRCELA